MWEASGREDWLLGENGRGKVEEGAVVMNGEFEAGSGGGRRKMTMLLSGNCMINTDIYNGEDFMGWFATD